MAQKNNKKSLAESDVKKGIAEHPYLSVVVPLYNEADNLLILYTSIQSAVEQIGCRYEIIFVDDGSNDGTTSLLRKLAYKKPNVKAIIFRRNFGQSPAMAAGFDYAHGQVIVSMDGDLQNDPADIPKLLAKLDEGYDLVAGWRKNRQDKLIIRKLPSKIANRLICLITNVKLHDTGCSLKAFRRSLLKRITLYGELHRFIPALTRLEGGHITEMVVNHRARRFGVSKYNLTRTFRVIMDLITMRLLMRHLENPMSFFGLIGLVFAAFGIAFFLGGIYLLFTGSYSISELNVLLTLDFICMVSAVQFAFLGLIGKLIVESGERKSVYTEKVVDNQNG